MCLPFFRIFLVDRGPRTALTDASDAGPDDRHEHQLLRERVHEDGRCGVRPQLGDVPGAVSDTRDSQTCDGP